MLKLAGIILISGGIAMAGFYKAFRIKESINIRKALFGFILRVQTSIESEKLSLNDIYLSYNNTVLDKTGFTEILKSGNENPFLHALEESELKLNKGIYEIYRDIAENLGKSRIAREESERLKRYISIIEKSEEELIKKDESAFILYRKLGILTGILAVIILI